MKYISSSCNFFTPFHFSLSGEQGFVWKGHVAFTGARTYLLTGKCHHFPLKLVMILFTSWHAPKHPSVVRVFFLSSMQTECIVNYHFWELQSRCTNCTFYLFGCSDDIAKSRQGPGAIKIFCAAVIVIAATRHYWQEYKEYNNKIINIKWLNTFSPENEKLCDSHGSLCARWKHCRLILGWERIDLSFLSGRYL